MSACSENVDLIAYMHASMSQLQLESAMHARIVTSRGGGCGGTQLPLYHTKRMIALNTQRGYITLVAVPHCSALFIWSGQPHMGMQAVIWRLCRTPRYLPQATQYVFSENGSRSSSKSAEHQCRGSRTRGCWENCSRCVEARQFSNFCSTPNPHRLPTLPLVCVHLIWELFAKCIISTSSACSGGDVHSTVNSSAGQESAEQGEGDHAGSGVFVVYGGSGTE